MNIHSCSSETDCTIEFSRPILYENNLCYKSNVNHDSRNNYQLTFIFMENQPKLLNNTDIMTVDEDK